ncbi:Hypothetical predicted protein [Mytilus galloprovincialis]|uniref:Uncharacterized protein n=1 Tax=Mytilus galloprovincialis TaxID=29158 RepID=A0A8B6HMH1_MYTGA|nr:Hypothetical predicted protein [Mytilus galloprovincialis]
MMDSRTEEVHSATQLCKDAYQMTQVTYADITFRRRALIQAEIQPKYKALCKDDVPVTDFLFGNDIKDKVKEMDAEYTVGKKLGKTNFNVGKKSHDDKKTFKKPYVHVPKRHFDKPSNKKDFLGKPTYKKKKFKKKFQEQDKKFLELPKQISLPVSTSVQQLNTQFTFSNTPDNFIGGKVKTFLDNWMSLTSDNWVLDVVKGYQIEFEQIPYQNKEPNYLQFDKDETNMVQLEIDKFLQKQIIKPVTYIKNQYVSNIFTRPKKDGTCRVILNLKVLNNDIEKHHF